MSDSAKEILPGELVELAKAPKPLPPQPGPGQRVIIVRGEKGRMERRIVPDETAKKLDQVSQVHQVDPVQATPPGETLISPGAVQEPPPGHAASQVPPGAHQAPPGGADQAGPGPDHQAPPGPGQVPPAGNGQSSPGPATSAPGEGKIPDFSRVTGSPGPGPVNEGEGAPGTAAPAVNQSQLVDYPAVAGMSFDMLTNILASIFGPEWRPESAEERTMVVTSLAVYMKSKNMPDIPPGLMLCLVCGIYSAKRLQAPPTKAKIKLIFAWLKLKLGRFFRRRVPAAAAAPALEPVAEEE